VKKISKKRWEIFKKILGIFFIIIGVIGLFLPFLQGILFILIGIALFKNKSIKKCVVDFFKKIKNKSFEFKI